ncbi:hypothetical protein [Pseudomonas sp. M30-35]|uniref:hypothetical protein n=1 Tax=Pseudomonas sp. M30-35 TaxID=1981174 RepID=UPI000B3BF4A5|nr:hypothetical protein [Pseudomonas sp. M30-35]ARU86677.1 hypothetical protein B9K09_01145 [Pseudomonas sp. M30-35]
MSVTLTEKIFMVAGIVDLGGLFLWISVCLYLAYTKMDLMFEHLKNCPAIMARAPLRHGGPLGKILLIGGISGIVTFPNFYLKNGGMNADDLNNFPVSLKRKLAILQWSVIVLLLLMLVLGAILQLDLV